MDIITLKLAQKYYDKRDGERQALYDEIKRAYENGELQGKGLEIMGVLSDPSELPFPGEPGQSYVIGSDLWVWAGTQWTNVGPFRGPEGPAGLPGTTSWSGLTDKPETFPPEPHTHTLSEITNAGTAASKDVGTSAGQIPVIGSNGKLDTSILPAFATPESVQAVQVSADTAKSTIDAHIADEGDPHPQYVAKSSLRNTFQDAAGVIDAPATANLVAITYDGLAGLMDGRYSAANASKLAGETAAQIKAGARTLSSAPLVVEVSSSAPESPVNGQIWYDSVNHKFRGYANGAWV